MSLFSLPSAVPRSLRRALGLAAWSALTMSALPPAAPPDASSPELADTLQMVAAHAVLRTHEITDPNSEGNRRALETMTRKALHSPPADPDDPEPAVPTPDSPLVGTLPGHFSVNNRGTADYSITLRIPEGRADLSPSPSISYFSSNGDDVLGCGFALGTGFPDRISRGRSILARDDEVRGIEYSSHDRYYLDGKRLLCISAPETKGRPGSVYRTEVDSFSRIEARGTGDEIETFVLHDHNGRTYFFGKLHGSDDAFQPGYNEDRQALDSLAYAYALKRVEDPLGNYVELSYEHRGGGDWVLTRIDYTGGPGIRPGCTMRFSYSEKQPRVPRYASLRRSDRNQLLQSIQVFAGDTLVTDYTLSYEPVGSDHAHRLQAVTGSFAADVGAPLQRLSPTRFQWSQPDDEGALPPLTLPASADAASPPTGFALGDFDGDGKKDQLDDRRGLSVALSTARGFGAAAPWLTAAELERIAPGGGPRSIQPGDFDGDGRTDVLVAGAEGTLAVLRSTGKRFSLLTSLDVSALLRAPAGPSDAASTPAAVPAAASRIVVGDFNGDGRDDVLIHATDGRLHVFLSVGTALSEEPPPADAVSRVAPVRTLAIDLNGDGLADYVWVESSSDTGEAARLRYALRAPEGGFRPPLTLHVWPRGFTSNGAVALVRGDFNGDDLPDFLAGGPGSDASRPWDWTLILSRGPTTTTNPAAPSAVACFAHALPARWTLPDGADVATFATAAAPSATAPTAAGGEPTPRARPSPPARAFSVFPTGLEIDHGVNPLALDLNHDGLDDFVWFSAAPATRGWWVSHSAGDGSFGAPSRLTGEPWERAPAPTFAATDEGLARRPSVFVQQDCDVDGDGRMDWLVTTADASHRRRIVAACSGVARHGSACIFRNLVTAITDGLGSSLRIGYKAAKDDAIYTPGAPVSYPVRELRSSQPVVSDKWEDTAAATPSQFSYQYAGNHLDLSGRGGLGFQAFLTLDRQTGFAKYQLLVHSFPMTGLTSREQSYRFWEADGRVAVKLIASTDHQVTFDAVTDPFTRRYFGTVFPFTSREVTSRWPNDRIASFSFAPEDPLEDARRALVFPPRFTSPAATRVVTSYWFDDQDPAVHPPLGWPAVDVPFLPRTGTELQGAAHASAAASITAPALSGSITHGNQVASYVDYGSGFFERTATTFQPPQGPDDPLVRLVRSRAASEHIDGHGTVVAPLKSYTYFGATPLLASESVSTPTSASGDPPHVDTTFYERDARGRVTTRRLRVVDPRTPDTLLSGDIVYRATAFDERLDLATSVFDRENGNQTLHYNPLINEASVVDYEDGGTVTVVFDGLGRSIRVSNSDTGYLRTTDHAWTRPGDGAWRQVQVVSPPAGVSGITTVSVHAERIEKTNTPTTTTYRDRTDRVIRVVTENAGVTTFVDTVFDIMDQEVAVSKPYAPDAASVKWTVKRYDDYGNVAATSDRPIPSPHPPAAGTAPASPRSEKGTHGT